MNKFFKIVHTTYEKDRKEITGMFNPKSNKATPKKQATSDNISKKKTTMNYYDDEFDYEYEEEEDDNESFDSYV
jgi:hypothetical protein